MYTLIDLHLHVYIIFNEMDILHLKIIFTRVRREIRDNRNKQGEIIIKLWDPRIFLGPPFSDGT